MTSPGSIFMVGETHGRSLRLANRVIAESQQIGWRALYAAIFEEAPLDATETATRHPSLIYHLHRPTEVSRRIAGNPAERALIGPRRICLTPGQATARWQHS